MENPLLNLRKERQIVQSSVDHSHSGIDHIYFYLFAFGILGIGTALWLSYNAKLFSVTFAGASAIWLGGSAVVLAIVLLFQAVLVASRPWNCLLILLESVALLGSFYNIISAWLVAAALIFCVLVIRASLHTHTALKEAIKIRFHGYASKFDSAFFTALTLFCAVMIVGLYQHAGGITENGFMVLFRGLETPLSYSLGVTVSGSMPAEEIFEKYVQKHFSSGEIMQLSESQRHEAIKQMAQAALVQAGDQLSTPFLPKETIGGYCYRLLLKGIAHIQALHLGPLIGFGILLLGVLFVRSFLIFVKIPVLLIAQIIYLLLKAIGIIRIDSEPCQREVIAAR